MTRLQKKCFCGSAFFHGLTVAVFLATAAFRSAPTISDAQVLNLIPARILDEPGVGGEPVPAPVQPQPAPPAIQPAPPRPQLQPAPVAPPAPPAPSKPQLQPAPAAPPKTVAAAIPRQPEAKPAASKPGPTPTPSRRQIKVDLTDVTSSTRASSRAGGSAAQAQAAAQAANSRRILQEIAGTFAALGSSIQSKDSSVKMSTLAGEGGGEAFVSYDNVVFNAYYNAWRPEVATLRLPVAVVKIVVSRTGNITSSEFVTKSGDPMLDRSVQRALDAVRDLPAFPASTTAAERSFIITFDPKALQSAG